MGTTSQGHRESELQTHHAKVDDGQPDRSYFIYLWAMYCIGPILSSIILTFNNTFNPMQQYNALVWASASIESETYQYRARSAKYSVVNTSPRWDDAAGEQGGEATQTFQATVMAITKQIRNESTLQTSSLDYRYISNSNEQARLRQQRLSTLFRGPMENENSVGGKPSWVEDDGYTRLSAEEYLQFRTVAKLDAYREKLPMLYTWSYRFQALIYICTGISVVLGTIDLDLYIAVSTAAVSLIQGMMEYQRLESQVVTLNAATLLLENAIENWKALSFVEKRMASNKDDLVKATERAIMLEANAMYTQGEGSRSEKKSDAGKGDKGGIHDGGKKGSKKDSSK